MNRWTRAAAGALAAGLLLPGPAAAGLSVTVQGVSGAVRDNVEARLSLHQYAEDGGEDEAHIRRLHRRAEDEIRTALQAFGHYEPRIRARLEGAAPDWVARYEIEPGPLTRLGEVRIGLDGDGRTFGPLLAAVAESPLAAGQPLRHAAYEDTKAALLKTAYQNGFLDAAFTAHVLRVDVVRRRADVDLRLDTGPRYFFGPVTIGQDVLDDAFLRRYLPLQEGEPFEPQKLIDTQFALADLGYFSSVEAVPRRDLASGRHIPVSVSAPLRPPRRYEIGAGYGTDTGARLSLGADFRRLTRTGHRLRTDARVSEVKNSLGGEYRIPLGRRAGENLGLLAAYTDEEVGAGESIRYDAGVVLDRTPGDWQRRWYLTFQYEQSAFPVAGVNTSRLLLPGLSLSRGESNDPIHARSGWYVFLDLHGAHEDAVSTTTFVQGRVLARGALPLGERGRLLGRAEWGASLVDEFAELPGSQRFFAGGDQSVRGYAYQSLGPRDATGAVTGGEYLTSYSVEAEHRVWGNWGVAAFFDAGNADNDPGPTLFRGVGAGIRYRAPIGTLQLDLAHPLDGEARGVRPHLGIRVGL